MTRTVHFLWIEPHITHRFESGVSLHGHTDRSQENLSSVSKYAARHRAFGLAARGIGGAYRNTFGRDLDFGSAYFIPPMAPLDAYAIEAVQLESLGLSPMVSITDHDTISGAHQLFHRFGRERCPIALEWTVPFAESYFHVGVHNLAPESAREIVRGLSETRCGSCRELRISCAGRHDESCRPAIGEWLERLSCTPDVLLVLNHPLWDTCGVGQIRHRELLECFLSRYRNQIHALELNGLRGWKENNAVIAVADEWKLPLISGGDRHGCEPNAVINLTNGETFSEFAVQIRAGEPSEVLFLNQYRQPLLLRKAKAVWEVLKSSPAADGAAVCWKDRICVPWADGRVLPLSSPEWSATFANKTIERPQSAECFPGDPVNGPEY